MLIVHVFARVTLVHYHKNHPSFNATLNKHTRVILSQFIVSLFTLP